MIGRGARPVRGHAVRRAFAVAIVSALALATLSASGLGWLASAEAAQRGAAQLPPGTASLAGLVYNDLNSSGSWSAGEPGIGNVTITLTGNDTNGAVVNSTATTGQDGTYSFSGLPAGTYVLIESQPAGYSDGQETVGTFSGNLGLNDIISGIVLADGDAGTGYNFGEHAIPANPSPSPSPKPCIT